MKTVITSVEEKNCTVVVPNNQLSLAIGNKGQNAKLAAKLTGYKIDIKPQTNPLTGEPAPELAEGFSDTYDLQLKEALEASEKALTTETEAAQEIDAVPENAEVPEIEDAAENPVIKANSEESSDAGANEASEETADGEDI